MINLFAGGRSVKDLDMSKIEGLKVFINFAFRHYKDIDVLIWGDDFVGHILVDELKEKPPYKLVCHVGNAGKAYKWIDDIIDPLKGTFTLIWALQWIRKNYPNEEITIYGLDGDGYDYYDGWVCKDHPYLNSENKEMKAKIEAIQRCYKELDQIEDRENIYVSKGSAYKGFPCR